MTGRDRDATGRARSSRSRDSLGRPLARAGAITPVEPDPPALAPRDALDRAQSLLDARRPFEAHEVLEAVWKSADSAERELWRGLAQLAVGITHSLRGNTSGAVALLTRSRTSLEPYAATTPYAIDIDGLRLWALAATEDLSLTHQPPRLRTKPA